MSDLEKRRVATFRSIQEKRRSSAASRFDIAHLAVVASLLFQLACSAEAPPSSTVSRTFEFGETSRLTIEASELDGLTRVTLILPVVDEGPAGTSRDVRIAHFSGHRFDTTAEPIEARPRHFAVRLSAEDLAPGLAMLEVDAIDSHPLGLRRFILEVTDDAPDPSENR